MSDPHALNQHWPTPTEPRPIVILGAGGIINDAHLPAYAQAGLPVAGVYDRDGDRARATADKHSIPHVFDSLEEAVAHKAAVFDIAVPPEHIRTLLEPLPDGAVVLIQKPLGRNLEEARQLREICRQKKLIAAVNFQLRFSPAMLALRDALQRGLLGELRDIELRENLRTPWEIFPYLKDLARVEILMHSIHYLDFIRSIAGEPRAVQASTIAHPDCPELHSTQTSAILEYGDRIRCSLAINHHYRFGPRHQASHFRIEGSRGAAVTQMGVNLNYPHGEPDTLELVTDDHAWADVPLRGNWFPEAFMGTMSNLQRYAAGEDAALLTAVDDAYHTMALVEACYTASDRGGVPLPE